MPVQDWDTYTLEDDIFGDTLGQEDVLDYLDRQEN